MKSVSAPYRKHNLVLVEMSRKHLWEASFITYMQSFVLTVAKSVSCLLHLNRRWITI